MATKPTETKAEIPDLAAEVAALRAEMSNVLAMIGQLGQDGATVAREGARAKFAESTARASEAANKAAERARGEWTSLEARLLAQTQEHPWQTLGMAALGGLVLGLLLRRR